MNDPTLRLEWRPDASSNAKARALGLVPPGEVFPWLIVDGQPPVRLTHEQAEAFEDAAPVSWAPLTPEGGQ
jgi:hypothetical protein